MARPIDGAAPDRLDGVPCRRGHFALESGLHADTWLELEALIADPCALQPRIDALAALVAPHRPKAICGPLLGGAFVAHAVALTLGLRFIPTERAAGVVPADGLFAAAYRVPSGLRSSLNGARCAVVDDAISAGSSVRASIAALQEDGASIAVVGALLVLGTRAVDHFAARGVPLVAAHRVAFDSWAPTDCPLCIAGVPLDRT